MSALSPPSLVQAMLRGAAGGSAGGFLGAVALALFGWTTRGLAPGHAFGLMVPFSIFLGLFCGVWVAWVHPGGTLPKWGRLLTSKKARLRLILSAPAVLIAWYVVGEFSWRELGGFEHRPAAGGVLIAASALGIFTLTAWFVDHAAELLVGKVPAPSVGVALGVALSILGAGAIGLIQVGTTSGVGGPLALFGVFRRPELDLSPVYQGLLLVGCGYACAVIALRFRPWISGVLLATTLVAGGWAVARASQMPFKTGLAFERAGGLSSPSLRVGRRLFDSDGDGFSAAFAGGDCQEGNARVHPGARDIPGNGVDEDCSGSDRTAQGAATGAGEDSKSKAQASTVELPPNSNVLLLTIDTLRWDLGYARDPRPARLSPHLDSLADRSTTYLNAYSLASYTSKSLAPMMIGRYASETKRTFEHFDRFAKDVPWIQERLQKAGIRTVSVQGYWYFFFEGYGFERGWDILDSTAAPKQVKIEGDSSFNGDKIADVTIERLVELSKGDARFFAWAHWVDPHSEYVRHEQFDFGKESRERYDSEVAFVDAQIGRILATLEETGLDDKTIIIVTSDHGEAFGEHGMIRHGFEVWEELVRVPLIVHVPGAPARRVQERRSIIDVAPTVLETFSIEVKGEGEFIRGTSLYRDALAPADATLSQRPVLVDMVEGPHNQERRAFYDGDYKIITTRGRVIGVYDLAKDPGEKNDLSEDSALSDRLREKMNQFLDALEQVPATR